MKTKQSVGSLGPGPAALSSGVSNSGGTAKSHSKRGSGSRERDKLKFGASGESGASSQCDTPPLADKEWSGGKVAGISAESVLCAAEQIGLGAGGGAGTELATEVAAALAEDVSFKLRQLIHSVWTRSQTSRRARVGTSDVNAVLKLMDTEPVLGVSLPIWHTLRPAQNYCYEPDTVIKPSDIALGAAEYSPSTSPTLTAHWLCDERTTPITPSPASAVDVHPTLRAYCMNISKALLKGSKKMKAMALSDLATNTRIGPILPNLLNLAVLVLNDDNLNTLHVPVKEPLKCVILDMVEALCANPCSLDTDVLKQLQRLYPALVADILNSGTLADKMISVMTKVGRTWPAFLHIGEKTLYEYLVGAESECRRVSGAVVRCLAALGRRAALTCLEPHLHYIDSCIHQSSDKIDLAPALLEASSLLLRPDALCSLEDHVTIDCTLYEMLADSILPCRLQPLCAEKCKENDNADYQPDDDSVIYGMMSHNLRLRLLAPRPRIRVPPTLNEIFERQPMTSQRMILRISGSRPRAVVSSLDRRAPETYRSHYLGKVVLGKGKLARFKYKLPGRKKMPMFSGYML